MRVQIIGSLAAVMFLAAPSYAGSSYTPICQAEPRQPGEEQPCDAVNGTPGTVISDPQQQYPQPPDKFGTQQISMFDAMKLLFTGGR